MVRKVNPWIEHVKKIKSLPENKDKRVSEILKIAKGSYKKWAIVYFLELEVLEHQIILK